VRAPRVRRATLIGLTAVLGLFAQAGAQSLDGSFAGTIRCDALPRQRPLVTKINMTVADGMAKYEREILDPTSGTGSGIFERGQGPVGPDGAVALKTHADATSHGYSYDAEYKGKIEGSLARFTGTQYWKIRGQTGTIPRPCTLELMKNPS
jgi:hypothetical protein